MKAGILPLFGPILCVGATVGIPSFALSSSLSSRTAAIVTPATIRLSDYLPIITTSAITTTENSNGSLNQSAGEAVHNAEPVTENAYNRAARDVENLALKSRVEDVLHKNKSTRGSDVHVIADNGTVTLWGQISSQRRAQTVQEIVANVHGVRAVNNELSYLRNRQAVTPPDSDSTGVAHPAYSDLAPAEHAPNH
jgi:hypothetical protein